MCEFEKNILMLLQEEKKRLSTVVSDKDLPYMKSLDYGIQSAQKKLEECECKKQLHTYEMVPATHLSYWSKMAFNYAKCSQLSSISRD